MKIRSGCSPFAAQGFAFSSASTGVEVGEGWIAAKLSGESGNRPAGVAVR
jgi:hypothetical protein